MRWVAGTVTVGTSGTEEKITGDNSNIQDSTLIYSIIFKARAGNTGNAYVREATNASAAVGMELLPGQWSAALNPHALPPQATQASLTGIKADEFFVDVATSGDIVDFMALIR